MFANYMFASSTKYMVICTVARHTIFSSDLLSHAASNIVLLIRVVGCW